MPIEIDELFVTAHIADPGTGNRETASDPAGAGSLREEEKLQIINEAVKQVMYLLERQKDR